MKQYLYFDDYKMIVMLISKQKKLKNGRKRKRS